jgi:hypothetical protein
MAEQRPRNITTEYYETPRNHKPKKTNRSCDPELAVARALYLMRINRYGCVGACVFGEDGKRYADLMYHIGTDKVTCMYYYTRPKQEKEAA